MVDVLMVGLTGSSGFVGSAVKTCFETHGHRVRRVAAPRLLVPPGSSVREVIDASSGLGDPVVARLAADLAGCDVVVHAAGLAEPGSSLTPRLLGANSALPATVAFAAALADVRRFVHLSSAAVQGSLDPLDETMQHAPLSPYARSKAMGELALGAAALAPNEVVIFRPTSVQGRGRTVTATLCRLLRARYVPVFGKGDAPLPLALVENVAAAVVSIAEAVTVPDVVLYPWEGMTVRQLLSILGPARVLPIPVAAGRVAVAGLLAARSISPRAVAVARRLDLFVRGQRQDAQFLPGLGFVPPTGPEGYSALCDGNRILRSNAE